MIEGSVVGTLLRLILSLATVLTLMVFLARYLSKRQNGIGSGVGASTRRKRGLPLAGYSSRCASRTFGRDTAVHLCSEMIADDARNAPMSCDGRYCRRLLTLSEHGSHMVAA